MKSLWPFKWGSETF